LGYKGNAEEWGGEYAKKWKALQKKIEAAKEYKGK
jgi:hypothetical protein